MNSYQKNKKNIRKLENSREFKDCRNARIQKGKLTKELKDILQEQEDLSFRLKKVIQDFELKRLKFPKLQDVI